MYHKCAYKNTILPKNVIISWFMIQTKTIGIKHANKTFKMRYHSLRTPTWNITESWELPTDGFQSLGFEIAGATLWGRLGLHVRGAEVANNDTKLLENCGEFIKHINNFFHLKFEGKNRQKQTGWWFNNPSEKYWKIYMLVLKWIHLPPKFYRWTWQKYFSNHHHLPQHLWGHPGIGQATITLLGETQTWHINLAK